MKSAICILLCIAGGAVASEALNQRHLAALMVLSGRPIDYDNCLIDNNMDGAPDATTDPAISISDLMAVDTNSAAYVAALGVLIPCPSPSPVISELDADGNPTGRTFREYVVNGEVVITLNSASPQKPWAEQRVGVVAEAARLAAVREQYTAAVIAGRKTVAPIVLADELTDDEIADLVALFPAWSAGVAVTADALYGYDGNLYKCIQPHTTQAEWTPDATPALWARVAAPGVIDAWVQPYGGSGTYEEGSIVTHGGSTWSNTVAAPTLNVWEPGVYGWAEL